MPKVVDKLTSINRLLLRKHQMDERRRVVKSKMVASRSYCGLPATSKHPRIRPEWVLHRHSVRGIEDPVLAMRFLLGSLGIHSK